MKYIKLYESFEDIHKICRKYDIRNYTINDDGSIDVDEYVNLGREGLSKLPLKFRNVSGDFYCDNNKIISFEGCPERVGGHFYCFENQLTSLEGCPNYIGYDFSCNENNIISFEGFPKHIGGVFNCYGNPIYEIWNLFYDKSNIEFFNDCDIIQDDVVILYRLNYFLDEIGKPTVKSVNKYKCV